MYKMAPDEGLRAVGRALAMMSGCCGNKAIVDV